MSKRIQKSVHHLGLGLLFGVFFLTPPLVREVSVCEGFLPKNNLYIGPDKKNIKGVNQNRFDEVIAAVERVYAPIARAKGGNLVFNKLWSSGEVNAYASRSGSTWKVDIHGGLARHAAISADGLAVIVCHEVGHHLGGTPKYSGDWASVEGQSDYFATLKCLRRVFAPEMSTWNGVVDPEAKEKCEAAFGFNAIDAKLCGRITMGGLSAANLSHALSSGPVPSLENRDAKVVSVTDPRHSQGQCRLDTYFNGSLCRVNYAADVSNTDHLQGVCKNTEKEEYGARPRCWYKPTINTPPIADPIIPPIDDQAPAPTPAPQPEYPLVAGTPTLNGVLDLTIRSPNTVITMAYDVSQFKNAFGMYFEILGPNMDYSAPNGTRPDPRAMRGGALPKLKGVIQIIPARHLPQWGTYRLRIIPLDRTGYNPVGEFSNPAILRLMP